MKYKQIIDIWKFDKCSDKILKFFERKCTLNIRSSKRAKRGNYEQIDIEEPGDMRVIESFFLKNVKNAKKCQNGFQKKLKEFENSFLKINSRFKLHKFEFSILKWHFKTKISKIWNFHFQNRISDFILKNFPMFIPEIPIFNLKIRVWHFWTIFGQNRMSKTKNLT